MATRARTKQALVSPLTVVRDLQTGHLCPAVPHEMAAIDTVTALAMATADRASKGTVYQHTHFLRPAVGGDFIVESEVFRFGKATAYAETRVRVSGSGELVAHAVLEFAF